MALKTCSFQAFLNKIKKEDKRILCYGAGMLPRYLEPFFTVSGIGERIDFFLDGNPEKAGQLVPMGGRSLPVCTMESLKGLNRERYLLLITAEYDREISKQLEHRTELEGWEWYSWPLLNLSAFLQSRQRGSLHRALSPDRTEAAAVGEIPRVLHYTWFGRGEKSPLHRKCIESWKRVCPEYEIREWNEENYSVFGNTYLRQAYETGKWAYVSDFARLDILYRHGGIYLDADVELKHSIEALNRGSGFVCAGEWPVPNSGAGIGCRPGHPLLKEMLEVRRKKPFLDRQGRPDACTNSNYEMEILLKHGFAMDFTSQCREDFFFYSADWIAPNSGQGTEAYVTDRTLGIHYCNNSWREAPCLA
jgi:hypothetical protein